MKKTIKIEGMNCGHCVKAVEKALLGLEGVSGVNVSLDEKQAVVDLGNQLPDAAMKEAVEEAGFEVTAIH